MLNRLLPLSILAALTLAPLQARADDDELDRLRDAVGRGQVMPLSALQDQVRSTFPGEIIKVEIEEEDGIFVYEFKVLQANGRLVEIEMDARDGRVLEVDDDDGDDDDDDD